MPGEKEARQFWKENFLIPENSLKESVPWAKFIEALAKFTKLKESDLEFLELVFRYHDPPLNKPNTKPKPISEVTLKRFVMLAEWFGPFFTPERAPTLLPMIKELTTQKWFHFDVSKSVAEMRLNNRGEVFLVRVRTDQKSKEPIRDQPFAISKLSKQGIRHKRIKYENGKYHVEVGPKRKLCSFSSITELVNDPELELKNPCPKEVIDPYQEDQ